MKQIMISIPIERDIEYNPTQKWSNCALGYRPERSSEMAMRKVRQELRDDHVWDVDTVVRQYFNTIDQDKLISRLGLSICMPTASAG